MIKKLVSFQVVGAIRSDQNASRADLLHVKMHIQHGDDPDINQRDTSSYLMEMLIIDLAGVSLFSLLYLIMTRTWTTTANNW